MPGGPAARAARVLERGRLGATRAAVRKAPLAPGCYVFRDEAGDVLYIGKSVALRQRLASYFVPPSRLDRKTRAMVSHAREVEWLTVGSEVEALILEFAADQGPPPAVQRPGPGVPPLHLPPLHPGAAVPLPGADR